MAFLSVKKSIILVLFLFSTFLVLTFTLTQNSKSNSNEITISNNTLTIKILHFNDIHARITPADKYQGDCSTKEKNAGECYGGFAKIATIIKEKSKEDDILVLDAGDEFTGTIWNSYYQGEAAATMMNAIGVDAMALGNHEFDYGPEVLEEFIDMLECPVISCNINSSQDKYLNNKILPYTIIEYKNAQIGIIGYTTVRTAVTSNPGADVIFKDVHTSVQASIEELKNLGVNIIICLGHIGYDDDIDLIRNITDVGLVIGGHSHTLPEEYPLIVNNAKGEKAAVMQAYWASKYIGYLEATYDLNGTLLNVTGELMILGDNPENKEEYVKDDEEVQELIKVMEAPLNASMDVIVAETLVYLENPGQAESNLGDLVADSQVWYIKNYTELEASDGPVNLALMNSGGVRISIDIGNITLGDIFTLLPFGNTLSVAKLTPKQIYTMLETGIYSYDRSGGEFPQVSGIKFVFCADLEPGSRITHLEIKEGKDGKYAKLDRNDESVVFNIVTNDFIINGGDGYDVFKDAEKLMEYGPLLTTAVEAYFGHLTPIEKGVDGRIKEECN